MSGAAIEMRLLEDVVGGGGALDLPDDGVHRVCYVVHGGVSGGGAVLQDDQSILVKGATRLVAARPVPPFGALKWRRLASRPLCWRRHRARPGKSCACR